MVIFWLLPPPEFKVFRVGRVDVLVVLCLGCAGCLGCAVLVVLFRLDAFRGLLRQGLEFFLVHLAYLPVWVNDKQIHNLIYSRLELIDLQLPGLLSV
jgi:hypothetical protein